MSTVVAAQNNVEQFAIKTEVFEGPLELLLDLIEKRKLLINDISLAEVTAEYMKHVSEMQEHSMRETAQFVVVAATLLLIKSKSLLPVLELTEEEESGIDDLEARLKLYQIYRIAAKHVERIFGQNVMCSRQFVQKTDPIFLPDKWTEKQSLAEAMHSVMAKLPRKIEKPKVQIKNIVTLEEMTDRLHKRIEAQMTLRFSELVGNERERTTVIVGFLAILESFKQGSILVTQRTRFEDIEMEREHAVTPRYY